MDDLYLQDFVGWTEQQARLLREAAARRTNAALDWDNLAEEIEDLGRSELRGLASQVNRLILHLLKLEFSTALEPRDGWIASVDDARGNIRRRLRYDPGLKPRLAEIIDQEAPDAAALAARALRSYGEDASAIGTRVRGPHAYSQDEIFGDWLPDVEAA